MKGAATAEARLALAEAYLQEAVYRSREFQSDPLAGIGPLKGGCGLGTEAAVELTHTPKAAALIEELFPGSIDAACFRHLRAVTAEWVERQDAFDRRRNHFLRDFRREHGADRTRYSGEVQAAYDDGLECINGEALAALSASAARLLAAPE